MRTTVVMVTTAAIVALTASPSNAAFQAAIAGAHLQISSADNDQGADSVAVTCEAGVVSVNGDPATPTLACSDLKTLDVDLGLNADDIDLSGATDSAFPALGVSLVHTVESSSSAPVVMADVVVGSPGADAVYAERNDQVSGGAGDDEIFGAGSVDGGGGDDRIDGPVGPASGGDGDDRIIDAWSGPLNGGWGGIDSLEYDVSSSGAAPLVVSLTDVSVSFERAGVAEVETAYGFEEFRVRLSGPSGEPRTVDSRGFSGRNVLQAFGGPDVLLTGAADDFVDGGGGDDDLRPGSGHDVVRGGSGADHIVVRDGEPDLVDCGAGTDIVVADHVDRLAACEDVTWPAPVTGPVEGPKKVRKGKRAFFTFSTPIDIATHQCRLDDGAWKRCTSPRGVSTASLRKGRHVFLVRAVLPNGDVDATPRKARFKVFVPGQQ